MKRLTAAVCGVWLAGSGCGTQPSKPCAREVRTVVDREAMRVHGLSENDDAAQTMNRMQSAVRCAQQVDVETLQTHVLLFRSRLEARGLVEELVALNDRLKDVGVTADSEEHTRRAAAATQEHLAEYAKAQRDATGSDGDSMLRAHLASMALDADFQAAFPRVTRAFVNFVGPKESCFTVLNHQELPTGAAVVSFSRAGTVIPLHGDSPTFGVSKGKPRVVRLCIAQPFKTDDVVQISVGGGKVWQQALVVTQDDEIRGLLRREATPKETEELCKSAREHSAKTACGLLLARRTP